MALKLMYITNRPDVASIVQEAGVDRIFVDMEYIGKADRQGGMDTVQSHHTVEDIRRVKAVCDRSQVMVRVNPIHAPGGQYPGSEAEINAAIEAGADVLMLPYFKTAAEVETFLRLVDGRAVTLPLVETPEAVEVVDDILALPGLDEIFVGLNDLSLGYGKKFMFELLTDGTVERLSLKFRQKGIPFGFGGIAALGKGMLPAEYVIREHYRLGSTCVILSRSFCNTSQMTDMEQIRTQFETGIGQIRRLEHECAQYADYFTRNQKEVQCRVEQILAGM
ncbi:MAG: aldolase [Oscillospiraceae bacterium]|nr:aldolase [Oscillospiraceae bacterium]